MKPVDFIIALECIAFGSLFLWSIVKIIDYIKAWPSRRFKHRYYKTGDKYVPKVICDRNGEVVLQMCKKCGQAESELTSDYCPYQNGGFPEQL